MSTPREILIKTLRRQGVEQVPVEFKLCPSQVEAFRARFGHEDYQTYFKQFHRDVIIELEPSFIDGRALFENETLPDDVRIDAWGVGHSKGSEAAKHMTRMHHPLKGTGRTPDEIEAYPLPRIKDGEALRVACAVRSLHERSLAAVGSMEMTVWEASWYIRSMEDLMDDMMQDEPAAGRLLDRVTEVSCARARLFAASGCDVICLGDDIGMQQSIMMSVPLWQVWIKPRLMRVIQAARSVKPDVLIYYHSCGYVLPFLEELISAGVDILNPVQPECMAFEDVYARVGGRISFWGTIGTQKLLPFGTPKQVSAEVHRVLDICGPQGGLLVAPTHLVEPEVPWENLEALNTAAKNHAWKNKL